MQDAELKSFRVNLGEAIKRQDVVKKSDGSEPQREQQSDRIKKLKIVKNGLNIASP